MKVLSGSWGILACASAIVSTVHAATVLDLQPTAASGDTVNYSVPTARGQIAAQARLISLNPSIGAWYLLEVPISGRSSETFHLEAPFMGTAVRLSAEGVEVQAPGVAPAVCDIFNPRSAHYIFRLAREGAPFTSVCGQSLFLRLDQSGAANTIKETGANVARSIGLEFLVDAYKDHLKADDNSVPVDVAGTDAAAGTDNGPREAEVAPSARARAVKLEKLDYDLEGKPAALHAGSWYRLDGLASAFFSFVRVGDAAPSILIERPDLVDPLTAKTRESVAYVVAFDLAQTTLGWAHGTSLPGVGNSPKVPSRGPGPDGFDRLAPLQTPGVVNPVYLSRLVGAFCGGFQREHGVQLGGPHAGQYNGFIEEGVVMSRMNRGLATIVVTKSGDVDVREWSAEDDANVANVRYARQNGLPLVSFDPAKNRYQPGLYVKESMSGYANWSGRPANRVEAGETQPNVGTNGGLRASQRRATIPGAGLLRFRHAELDGAHAAGVRLRNCDSPRHEQRAASLHGRGPARSRRRPHRAPGQRNGRHRRPDQRGRLVDARAVVRKRTDQGRLLLLAVETALREALMKTKNIYFCAILAISASASARGLLELQPYAQTQRVAISGGGAAQLTNVNPVDRRLVRAVGE